MQPKKSSYRRSDKLPLPEHCAPLEPEPLIPISLSLSWRNDKLKFAGHLSAAAFAVFLQFCGGILPPSSPSKPAHYLLER